MIRTQLNERTIYITPDGQTVHLEAPPKRVIISEEGMGMPPIEYVTQRGPLQHGESFIDFFLRPRNIQMVVRHNFCDRASYWDGRASLLNGLRPNRIVASSEVCGPDQPLGKIRKYLANRTVRDLDVLILEGPRFEARNPQQWDERAYTEVLRWIAFNPVWYDPTLQTVSTGTLPATLTFPITFPITFGDTPYSFDITYPGTWESFPTIRAYGPFSDLRIENETTGEVIELEYAVPSGAAVVFCLDQGYKTVTLFSSEDGVPRLLGADTAETNIIGSVTPDSDIGTFHLAPDPIAPNGVNTITVAAGGGGEGTSVQMLWYNRYIGV